METQYETTKHYNDTVELVFDTKKHHYTWEGETVDGVTSILGVINKPALVYWSANQAAEYVEANLPLNTPLDEVQKKGLVEGAKKAHRNFLKDAADYGTLLHDWIECYIKSTIGQGSKPNMPTNPKLKESAEKFLNWIKEFDVKFIASEQKVMSKKYKFAGTFDFLATVKGKIVLGDIKTSSGIYDEMWLQTAAYKGAYLEEFADKHIDHTLIFRCGKDGSFEVKELNDYEKNYNAFVSALILYRRLKEMKFLNYINQN